MQYSVNALNKYAASNSPATNIQLPDSTQQQQQPQKKAAATAAATAAAEESSRRKQQQQQQGQGPHGESFCGVCG